MPSAVKRSVERERWSSTRFVLFAFTFNALCLFVLLANLLTGNVWWKVAVPIAVVCLLLGGAGGVPSQEIAAQRAIGASSVVGVPTNRDPQQVIAGCIVIVC